MFLGKKKAIEIPKDTFVKYEIKTYFLKLKTTIILHRTHQREIIKYPAVNITLLKKDEKQNIYNSLNKCIRKYESN